MRRATAALACALVLTGCGSDAERSASGGIKVDIAIEEGTVSPQGERVEVAPGEPVTLHVTSDADEVLHVHSEPEHEYEVSPGDDKSFTFTVDVPGQVAVEAHHLDVTIVQLVVRP